MGSARMIAPYAETSTVVKNGSVTPNVSGTGVSAGSGSLAMSSSSGFCQKQRAKATPSASNATIIRLRSSSR